MYHFGFQVILFSTVKLAESDRIQVTEGHTWKLYVRLLHLNASVCVKLHRNKTYGFSRLIILPSNDLSTAGLNMSNKSESRTSTHGGQKNEMYLF